MLSNILTVAQQVLILFIIIGIGVAANKTKILDASAIKGMTDLMLYIVTPAVIINSFNRSLDTEMMRGLLIVFAAAVIMHIINIVIARLTVHDPDKCKERVYKGAMVCSNCGYMSFPLQYAILGSDGVFYGAAYVAVFNIIVWTWLDGVMRGSFSVSPKKIILNPGILGTLVGLIIFFLSIPIPEVIADPIESIANLNTPVAMIIIGYHLAEASLKLRGKNVYFVMFYRLIISPAILVALMLICGIKGDVLIVCTIAASAPVAAIVAMFASKYDADTQLAAGLASLSTIISIITMPVIVGIAQFF